MGAVFGFLIGRVLFGNPLARRGVVFFAVLMAGSLIFVSASRSLANIRGGQALVEGAFALVVVLALLFRAMNGGRRPAAGVARIAPLILALLVAIAGGSAIVHGYHSAPVKHVTHSLAIHSASTLQTLFTVGAWVAGLLIIAALIAVGRRIIMRQVAMEYLFRKYVDWHAARTHQGRSFPE